MADLLREMREAMQQGVNRAINTYANRRHISLPNSIVYSGNNPTRGGQMHAPQQIVFTTGYDGTSTTVAFVLDQSAIDGPDVLIA